MAKPKMQPLSFNIAYDGKLIQWHLRGYVVGAWAIHHPHAKEGEPLGADDIWPRGYWCISHLETGGLLLMTRSLDDALQAAERLDGPEDIAIQGFKVVSPPKMEWLERMCQLIGDLEISVFADGCLYRPDIFIARYRAKQAKETVR